MSTEMRSSYLVQRLEKPWQPKEGGLLAGLGDNPFSFGGGYVNGGLSKDAMALLRPIFSFDYMGSAEYEFGAVPEALGVIAKQADEGALLAWTFEIPLTEVKGSWREPKGYKPPKGEKRTIYALARADWTEEVEKRIRQMAKEGYGYRAKEAVMLDGVLRPAPDRDYEERTAGWLELDNGYMFFIDVEMWTKTAALFGVDVTVDA